MKLICSKLTLLQALSFMCAVLVVPPAVASADPRQDPYPLGQPTYWAWQNRPDLPSNLGAAKYWDDRASAQGWPVGPYPRTGDIAVFEPGVLGADPVAGHLAVVRQVFDNGTYSTTQMDASDCKGGSANCGHVNTRQYPIAPGTHFIHYLKDMRTTWGFASGAAGWTPTNLGVGASEGQGWRYPLAGGEPQLVSPNLDIPLDGYDAIQIEMLASHTVSRPAIRLFFATAAQPQFSTRRSSMISAKADGLRHTYTFYLGSYRDWGGRLARLSFHPAGASATGSVRVDRIKLIYTDPVGNTNFAALRPAR